MKAKLVNEDINQFTREGDPFDKLQLGDPEIRKINLALKGITEIISSGYNQDMMNFTEVINMTDDLRNVVDYAVITHLKKKFGFPMKIVKRNSPKDYSKMDKFEIQKEIDQALDKYVWWAFSTIVKGNRLLIFKKSSTSRSFEMILYEGPTTDHNQLSATPASTSMKTLDDKINLLNKKFQIL